MSLTQAHYSIVIEYEIWRLLWLANICTCAFNLVVWISISIHKNVNSSSVSLCSQMNYVELQKRERLPKYISCATFKARPTTHRLENFSESKPLLNSKMETSKYCAFWRFMYRSSTNSICSSCCTRSTATCTQWTQKHAGLLWVTALCKSAHREWKSDKSNSKSCI